MADFKMPEINNVILAGNLTRDPVYRTTQSGYAIVNFTVASNRRYRDRNDELQEDVSFVGVIARNKLAESCNNRLKKGSAVLIEGELQSRNWKTDEGKTYRVVEIKARRIQFLNRPGAQQQNIAGKETSIKDEHSGKPEQTTGEESPSPSNEPQKPDSFEDDQYKKIISSEESEQIRRDSSNS